MDLTRKHLNIKVIGRVQGVGFRYTALQAAQQFGILGYVRNLPDGSVLIEAEGTESQLNDFLNFCRKGPSRAKISQISSTEGNCVSFTEFEIR